MIPLSIHQTFTEYLLCGGTVLSTSDKPMHKPILAFLSLHSTRGETDHKEV
jgi:hypothetical protein